MLRVGRTLKSKFKNAGSWSTASASAIAVTGAMGTLYFVQSNQEVAVAKAEKAHDNKEITRKTSMPSRDSQISDLSSGDKVFDVLVIGGGATGAGAALDATTRGLSTALIEKGDFGNETSSRSTKLIWAGIRYIATATSGLLRLKNVTRPIDAIQDFYSEFRMVSNCHKERRLLLENNPHLTNWQPIAVPVDSWFSWPPPFNHPLFSIAPMVLPLVFKFYDGMSGFTCPPSHIMGRRRAERKFPQLATEDANYYSVFYEGSHNDSRTATYIALTAAEHGACVTNYTEMVEVLHDSNGKAIGVKVKDNMNGGKTFDVYAKAIVFAGGPFTDHMRKIENPNCQPAVAAAAGTHIVLPGYYCSRGVGMLDINTSDGRFLFFLPWQGKTLVGTTDRKGPVVSSHGPPEAEIQWLLNECKKYLSHTGHRGDGLEIRRTDVLSAWQGFRPLASDPNAPPGAPVSRDHIISENPDTGITFITGGKWTTYREMAEDVIDRVVKSHGLSDKAGPCVTGKIQLRGGVGYTRNLPIQLVQQFGVTTEVAEHLARTYGTHAREVLRAHNGTGGGKLLLADYPYLEQEVEYACKHEMGTSLTDMLTLRTRLAYLDSDAAAMIAPKVADLMGNALGWSKKRKKEELKGALEVIASFGGPVPKTEKKEESVQSIEEIFHSFDADKSGYIGYDELKLCLKHIGAPFKSEEDALNTFNSIDKNADGKIDLDDFMKWWGRLKRRETLSDRYRISNDKLGSGSDSRGAAFG